MGARRAAEFSGPDKPFLAGGYSTGAALVTLYALRSTDDPSLPRPARLYLVSAAIGVSKLAVLTNVMAGLSFVPYFEKSKWLEVFPEYDPYKYNSFPVNAANQIWALTRELQSELAEAEERGTSGSMPPITAFQSLVDATILASDVVRGLLMRLPREDSELVVFDVNRADTLQALVSPAATTDLAIVERRHERPVPIDDHRESLAGVHGGRGVLESRGIEGRRRRRSPSLLAQGRALVGARRAARSRSTIRSTG